MWEIRNFLPEAGKSNFIVLGQVSDMSGAIEMVKREKVKRSGVTYALNIDTLEIIDNCGNYQQNPGCFV